MRLFMHRLYVTSVHSARHIRADCAVDKVIMSSCIEGKYS